MEPAQVVVQIAGGDAAAGTQEVLQPAVAAVHRLHMQIAPNPFPHRAVECFVAHPERSGARWVARATVGDQQGVLSDHRALNRCSGRCLPPIRQSWLAAISAVFSGCDAFGASLAKGETVKASAARCDVAVSTAFRWRHRFLAAARSDSEVLKGIVEADETYVLESRKGARGLERKARRRGGKAKKRGLSREQVPVLMAADRSGTTVSAVLPRVDAADFRSIELDGPYVGEIRSPHYLIHTNISDRIKRIDVVSDSMPYPRLDIFARGKLERRHR